MWNHRWRGRSKVEDSEVTIDRHVVAEFVWFEFGLAPEDWRWIADNGSYMNSRENWWRRQQLYNSDEIWNTISGTCA